MCLAWLPFFLSVIAGLCIGMVVGCVSVSGSQRHRSSPSVTPVIINNHAPPAEPTAEASTTCAALPSPASPEASSDSV